jgi:hypothetical protein
VAIDNLPARPADAPAAPPANPAVPEWLRPGAEIVKDADSTRSVGAAKTSGRVLGTAAGWLAAGTRGAGAAWWRYVRASDLIDSIEPRTPNEWDFIHGVRKKRWITCACTTGGGILGSLGAWIGTVAGMGMTAVPGLEAAGTMEGAAAMLAATITGRIITRRAVAELPAGEQPLALEGDVVTSGETLLDALTAIKVPEGARVVAHQPGPDDTSVTIVDLPANFTVTSLKGKLEELAGALGRDTTMVDIRKAAHANQAAIWLSSADPFEVPRPSPLLTGNAAVDAWRYGIAVAWNKRGETSCCPSPTRTSLSPA